MIYLCLIVLKNILKYNLNIFDLEAQQEKYIKLSYFIEFNKIQDVIYNF